MSLRQSTYFALFSLFVILSACSTTQQNIERGNGYTFRVGYPEIRLSAIGVISDDDQPLVSTATELIINSFIFKNIENERVAEVLLEIRVINKETGALYNYSETIKVTDNEELRASGLDSFQIQKNFQVDPGFYDVYATVTDMNSQKDISIKTETSIPDPDNPTVNLTSILLLTKDNNSVTKGFYPTTTYDVPAKMDSLRFEFQATNNNSNDPLLIRAKLIRFETDTLPAQPMSYNNYTIGSLRYKGIDYREDEEVASTTRRLTQPGSVYIEFTYPNLERGNYRFEVTTENSGGQELYQARDFSIKSRNYPILSNVRELAAPLAYLMNDKEYKALMRIQGDQKLKQAVDRFWLENIGNPNIARQVIQKYYDRVEQANKLFSSYKEGWKTDMGMMYILFGQPWYVDETVRRMSWSYSYDINDFQTNFFFFKPKQRSKYYPFDYFILNRSPEYFNLEYRQKQLWLTGQILTDNL
jgi:GWxTD domain-containing protein